MIKLLTHHVLVKTADVTEVDERYRSAKALGIELPELKREQQAVEYGIVVDVGPTAFVDYGRDPTILKVGDRISFARYSGKSIKDSDDTEFLLLNDSDILVVIE